ncbi:MAG TPA: prephenate dehydrogenase/arogenate dehydrogenase family protein [Candidatus Stackebrandtia excrementipullorum]|nr:prephenate dehydrogenase/arogenate dehydrogenase family protein [Candidatus Stackebrandtia excrementipullorum]
MRVGALRYGVVGAGLIGGSLLRRLADTGVDLVGWDPDPAVATLARAHRIRFVDDLVRAVADRDVVFLATPLSTLEPVLDRIAAHVAPGALVTDVGSTKSGVAAAAASSELADRFIPGHPMAGSEKSGFAAADSHLFDGATWVLCPDPAMPLPTVRTLITIITTIFDAHVTVMSPERHDEVVALSSHVPHLLAGALAGSVERGGFEDAVLGLAAGSFRDGTRVAGTRPDRTVDMLMNNADAVVRRLAEVQNLLNYLATAVADRNRDELVACFSQAQRVRIRLTDQGRPQVVRRFRQGHGEREFLATTGEQGVAVTGCTADGDDTVYSISG